MTHEVVVKFHAAEGTAYWQAECPCAWRGEKREDITRAAEDRHPDVYEARLYDGSGRLLDTQEFSARPVLDEIDHADALQRYGAITVDLYVSNGEGGRHFLWTSTLFVHEVA